MMGAGTCHWHNLRAEQPGFTVHDDDMAVDQLDFVIAQTFDFPALQDKPGFIFIFDKVVVTCFLVDDYCGVVISFGFWHVRDYRDARLL